MQPREATLFRARENWCRGVLTACGGLTARWPMRHLRYVGAVGLVSCKAPGVMGVVLASRVTVRDTAHAQSTLQEMFSLRQPALS